MKGEMNTNRSYLCRRYLVSGGESEIEKLKIPLIYQIRKKYASQETGLQQFAVSSRRRNDIYQQHEPISDTSHQNLP